MEYQQIELALGVASIPANPNAPGKLQYDPYWDYLLTET